MDLNQEIQEKEKQLKAIKEEIDRLSKDGEKIEAELKRLKNKSFKQLELPFSYD